MRFKFVSFVRQKRVLRHEPLILYLELNRCGSKFLVVRSKLWRANPYACW